VIYSIHIPEGTAHVPLSLKTSSMPVRPYLKRIIQPQTCLYFMLDLLAAPSKSVFPWAAGICPYWYGVRFEIGLILTSMDGSSTRLDGDPATVLGRAQRGCADP